MKVLVGSLDEQVLQAQVSLFLQGKLLISKWLQTANDEGVFEEAANVARIAGRMWVDDNG